MMKQPYEIVIRGHLTSQWGEILEGMQIACLEDGNTRLAGVLEDQAALYGLLMLLRDLGMELLSVDPVESHTKEDEK